MKQEFPTERKFHFNLRKPKGGQATPIYFVVSIGGKQYKFATNVKVNPRHWDNSKQLAIVSNTNSRLDNKNNRIVNERLEQIKAYYMEFICYLCNQEETPANVVEVLKTFIYKDMTKKKTITIDVINTIKEAFRYYYKIKPVKDTTYAEYEKILNIFIEYITEKKLNDSVEVFKQSGLNAYRDYNIDLKEKGEIGIERINKRCELIMRLINKVLVVEDKYSQFGFTPVSYTKQEDKRQQDDIKRFPLYNEEIQAIKDCKTLTNKEQEYRTIFLLQCACGQRISDLQQILKGEYEEKDGVITLRTIKKGIYASLLLTNEIREYLQNIKQIQYVDLKKKSLEQEYNKTIKDICQKAGLNRVIKWKDSRGESFENPLWQVVVSHCARHTFITNKVKEEVPYDTLCLMTGHSDDKMIKSVYANLTKEDKADKVRNYFANSDTTGEIAKKESKNDNKQVDLFNELFAISELTLLKDMQESGVNIYDQPEIKTIFRKLKDIKLLSKAIEQYKGKCPDMDKDLSKLIWNICRANYETKAYNMYQYKCLKLGISNDKLIPEDILGQIWDEELRDLQENWQLYEYLEKNK